MKVRKKDIILICFTYFYWPVYWGLLYYQGIIGYTQFNQNGFYWLLFYVFSPITSIAVTVIKSLIFLTGPESWYNPDPFLRMWGSWLIAFVLFNITYFLIKNEFPVKYFWAFDTSGTNTGTGSQFTPSINRRSLKSKEMKSQTDDNGNDEQFECPNCGQNDYEPTSMRQFVTVGILILIVGSLYLNPLGLFCFMVPLLFLILLVLYPLGYGFGQVKCNKCGHIWKKWK